MLDPIRRLLAEAGKAKQTRAFWQTVTDILSEYAGGARVELTYKGLSESGTLDAGAAGTDGETFLTDYHDAEGRHVSARFEGLPAGFPGEVLRSTIEIATHLAVMVARRSGLEREGRLGTFLVELSRWLLAAPERELLLRYTLQSVTSLVDAQGAYVALRGVSPDTLRVASTVGQCVELDGAEIAIDASATGRVVRTGEPFLTDNILNEADAQRGLSPSGLARAAMIAPLRTSSGVAGAAARRPAVARPGPRDPALGGPPHLRLHHHRRVGGRAGQPVGGTVRPDRRAARPARANRPREARHGGRDRQRRGARGEQPARGDPDGGGAARARQQGSRHEHHGGDHHPRGRPCRAHRPQPAAPRPARRYHADARSDERPGARRGRDPAARAAYGKRRVSHHARPVRTRRVGPGSGAATGGDQSRDQRRVRGAGPEARDRAAPDAGARGMGSVDGGRLGAGRPAGDPRPYLRSVFHHQRTRRGHRPGPRDLSARRDRSRREDLDRRLGARRGAIRGGAAGGARERGDDAHRLSRPSMLQDARAVEAEHDQAGGPERHQQRGESPVEPESTGPNGGGDEPGGAREEAQDHDFLPRHQDAEHVAPAEHAHGKEHQAVRDLDGVDQVERPREEAKQSEYRVAREVQREREENGSHAVEGHGVKIPVWKPRVHISSCRGKSNSGPGSAPSPTS